MYPSRELFVLPAVFSLRPLGGTRTHVTAQYQARSQSLDLQGTRKRRHEAASAVTPSFQNKKRRKNNSLLLQQLFLFFPVKACESKTCTFHSSVMEVSTNGWCVSKLTIKVRQNKACLKECWLSRLQVRGHMTSRIHQTHDRKVSHRLYRL